MVRDQIIYNWPGTMKFRFLKLSIELLDAEAEVKSPSYLPYYELDLSLLGFEKPTIQLAQLPRASHLYQINRIVTEDG